MSVNIKNEAKFGIDNFGNQKILSLDDTIAQMIINILFLRPGQLPGLPHIGIDISKYLYRFEDELDTNEVLSEIRNQCSPLMQYININGMILTVVPYREDSLLVLSVPLRTETNNSDIMIAFRKEDEQVTVDYTLINIVKESGR